MHIRIRRKIPSHLSRDSKRLKLLTLRIFCFFFFNKMKITSKRSDLTTNVSGHNNNNNNNNNHSTKRHEILTSGSIENSSFPLNRAVEIFWLTAHALHLTGFSIFLDPRKAGNFSIVLPFWLPSINTIFTHNKLLSCWDGKNACTSFIEQNNMIAVQAPCLFFLRLILRKQPTFREVTLLALAKRRLSNERRNSILMTCTTEILVVLLIGWKKIPSRHNQSEPLPRSG